MVASLDEDGCRQRFAGAQVAVLGTVHPERGVDLVPVVFAVVGDELHVPVDVVKPKASTRLQRLANIAADPRVSLLVDHRSDDWDELWWVRAKLQREEVQHLPETLQVRKDLDDARRRIDEAATEDEVRDIVAAINTRIRWVNSHAVTGPPSTTMPE